MTKFAALTYHILHRHETTTLALHSMQRPGETSIAFVDYHYKQREALWPCSRSCRPNFGIRLCCQSHRPRNISRRYNRRRPLTGWSHVGRWAIIDTLYAPPPFWLWSDCHVTNVSLALQSIQNLYCGQVSSKEKPSTASPNLEPYGANNAAEAFLLTGPPPSSTCTMIRHYRSRLGRTT
ncbi:hypothetical protein BDP55DRAFT_334286 [Colletotrichum godetiae]|uniref:Uncharacterized protein n=1 Tax=Colletotrichum godetiae TaxID=1209918 RepID=A0AAJ0AAR2_9PEZI|nr:uncharacterized protein BDP55DRAFT_334286 [Colletotrichum godetiae]KAK1659713.1 hypothetical protein BDP55DRAFT_334286 [Colletotrichum godetiae]